MESNVKKCSFRNLICIILLLSSISWGVHVKAKGEFKVDRETWYDDISKKAKESAKQYARDALREAVQSAMENTIEYEETDDINYDDFVDSNGRSLGELLNARNTAEEKDREQERRVYTYFVLFLAALVIFILMVSILLICCVYNRFYKYFALLNSAVWLIWLCYTIVIYYQEYCDWVSDDDD